MKQIAEPASSVPVVAEYDVLVCGGGPAGAAAALAAARQGARTGLVEGHGCLGGIWTAGMLSCIIDAQGKGGIIAEILARLEERGARTMTASGQPTRQYDVEQMKLLLDDLCAEAGVDVHLHTRVCAALTGDRAEGQADARTGSRANNQAAARRLTHAITESRSGRQALAAQVFVDCTGDGDLAARAGCGFDLGHPEDGRTQPMSLMALLTGLRAAELDGFIRDEEGRWAAPKDALRSEMERGGLSPSYSKPTLFRIRDDLFALMANHEYGVSALDARQVSAATQRARREVHDLAAALRTLGPPWQDLRIVATADQIGVREARRIHGLCTVTAADLERGARHVDAACHVTFGVDVHATDPTRTKGIEAKTFAAQPYDIPLGALIARDVDALMMAGRCISGDFHAHASYRVTGNAAAMGESAGQVAARAAADQCLPQEVSWRPGGTG